MNKIKLPLDLDTIAGAAAMRAYLDAVHGPALPAPALPSTVMLPDGRAFFRSGPRTFSRPADDNEFSPPAAAAPSERGGDPTPPLTEPSPPEGATPADAVEQSAEAPAEPPEEAPAGGGHSDMAEERPLVRDEAAPDWAALVAIVIDDGMAEKAVAAAAGVGQAALHIRVIHERRRRAQPQCAVPGCAAALSANNKTGVCREHNHAAGHCRCVQCSQRADETPSEPEVSTPQGADAPAITGMEGPAAAGAEAVGEDGAEPSLSPADAAPEEGEVASAAEPAAGESPAPGKIDPPAAGAAVKVADDAANPADVPDELGWTPREDLKLLMFYSLGQNSYTISQKMPGRSAPDIVNRFRHLVPRAGVVAQREALDRVKRFVTEADAAREVAA